jgi:ComF family protein
MIQVDAWLQSARTQIGALLWPPLCVLCGRVGSAPSRDLCAGCEADLPVNDRSCVVCAEPLQLQSVSGVTCGACLRRRPRFDTCIAPYRYAYPLDHMIRHLKYGGSVAQGRVLGDLLSSCVGNAERHSWPQMLLPVPLAPARFRKRGYNQAIVLAEQVHRRLSIPLHTDLLVRTRETLEQAGLEQRARRNNIRGAFALTRALSATHVAIVDDVVTTGSTVNELARTLKRAGVKCVDVWAVARAGR